MLFAPSAEGNLLQVETSSQILKEKRVCETIGPFNSELLKMQEAEVHVFSDSVLCMGKQAMNEPEIKFNKSGMVSSGNTGNPQRELMTNKVS